MSETYEFTSATPIRRAPRQGAGRRPAPNPFLDAVRAIAGQTTSDGAPEARQTTVVLDAEHGETFKTRSSRIRRQLTAAGKAVAEERNLDEPFMIDRSIRPIEGTGDYSLIFWDRNAGR